VKGSFLSISIHTFESLDKFFEQLKKLPWSKPLERWPGVPIEV
jgi:hypothetical protein